MVSHTMATRSLLALSALALASPAAPTPLHDTAVSEPPPVLLFCCGEENDLYRAAVAAAAAAPPLRGSRPWLEPIQTQRVDPRNCTAAAASLHNDSGVLLLADGAPAEPVEIPDGLIALLSTSYIRLYIEFAVPTSAAAMPFGGATGRTPCP